MLGWADIAPGSSRCRFGDFLCSDDLEQVEHAEVYVRGRSTLHGHRAVRQVEQVVAFVGAQARALASAAIICSDGWDPAPRSSSLQ